MVEFLYIQKDYLDELLQEIGKRVVGKLMRRMDLLEVNQKIKDFSKDAVYEGFREVKDLMIAYDRGLEADFMEFKSTGKVISTSSTQE